MGRSRTIALAALTVLALPPQAVAAIPPPPGNSAADQYAESYPSADGDRPTSSPTTADPARSLGRDNAAALEQAGPDGAAAAAAAAATSPTDAQRREPPRTRSTDELG